MLYGRLGARAASTSVDLPIALSRPYWVRRIPSVQEPADDQHRLLEQPKALEDRG
jgi:hypothetical protein